MCSPHVKVWWGENLELSWPAIRVLCCTKERTQSCCSEWLCIKILCKVDSQEQRKPNFMVFLLSTSQCSLSNCTNNNRKQKKKNTSKKAYICPCASISCLYCIFLQNLFHPGKLLNPCASFYQRSDWHSGIHSQEKQGSSWTKVKRVDLVSGDLHVCKPITSLCASKRAGQMHYVFRVSIHPSIHTSARSHIFLCYSRRHSQEHLEAVSSDLAQTSL